MYKDQNTKTLSEIHKDLTDIYTLIQIEQEALDLCYENDKDCAHITCIIDVILDKFTRVLKDLKCKI